MPFTPPSIYAPGTVDLLTLIQQSKNGIAGLRKAIQPDSQDLFSESLGPGIGPSSASAASGTGTAESVSVGNAVGSAIGNAVMGAVIGPIGVAAASQLGLAPQGLVSQAIASGKNAFANMNSISIDPSPEGIAAATQDSDPGLNGSVADGVDGVDSGASGASANDGGGANGGDGGDFAKGGIIRGKGTSTSDSINIKASDGEAVLHAGVVQALGKPFIDFLNTSIPNVLGGN